MKTSRFFSFGISPYLICSLLSFGWPAERTVWIPARTAQTDLEQARLGRHIVQLSKCCGSMRPAIQGGEMAYVENYRPGMEIHEGEIAADGSRLHRIVALSKNGVKLSGDANKHSDPWEPRSNLKFIVRVIVRPR